MTPFFPVFLASAALLAAGVPDWSDSPSDAAESARSLGKPVVLLWQAGSGAVEFTEGIDKLFSTWPAWTRQASQTAVFSRARAWESSLPPGFPAMPDGGQTSAVVLWKPGSDLRPRVWTEVPPVLDLSRALSEVSGRPLDDPYEIAIRGYAWGTTTLDRFDRGPWWYGWGPDGETAWVEEGPLGSVLVLREFPSGRRAAFPLEGDWSYLFDPQAETWTPWNQVVVNRR